MQPSVRRPATPRSARPVPCILGSLLMLGTSVACAARMPPNVGTGLLADCPSTPNCVSSLASPSSPAHVEPLEIVGPPQVAWAEVQTLLEDWPRTRVLDLEDGALHAECETLVFRYVDDLELRLRADANRIDVRSASRLGHSDLGANRRRVEALRSALAAKGVVAAAEP